jgi:hypothetical protein
MYKAVLTETSNSSNFLPIEFLKKRIYNPPPEWPPSKSLSGEILTVRP